MALIDKYTGQVSYKGLIARYVSKKPKRGTRASQGKRVTQYLRASHIDRVNQD